MKRAGLLIALVAWLVSGPAAAERIVSSLSVHRVMITQSFTGLDIVLFGTVERDAVTVPRRSGYDLAVTVTGPREWFVTRRKERVAGIWVNAESRVFVDVPAYLAVLATRPFDDFTSADAQRRLQLGIRGHLLPQEIGSDVADVVPDDPFRMAFVRLREQRRLYVEQTGAVTFLTPQLFRATIPLPPEIPIGNYEIDIKLFADGAMIARANSAFEIVKVGFERFVANAAQNYGLLYGLAAVLMALMTGWFASVVFRRD
jgi:uncharacterized protein (TIGR02186 family)